MSQLTYWNFRETGPQTGTELVPCNLYSTRDSITGTVMRSKNAHFNIKILKASNSTSYPAATIKQSRRFHASPKYASFPNSPMAIHLHNISTKKNV